MGKTKRDDTAVIEFSANGGFSACGTEISIPAGLRGTWTIYVPFTALRPANGEESAAEELELQVEERGIWLGDRLQVDRPLARDYVVAEAPGRFTTCVSLEHEPPRIRVTLKSNDRAALLDPGDDIVLRVGDQRSGGSGSSSFPIATRGNLHIRFRRPKDGWRAVPGSPFKVATQAHPPVARYRVTAQSITAVDEPFTLHVVALDINGNALTNHRGRVDFDADHAVHGLSPGRRFESGSGGDVSAGRYGGVLRIEGVRISRPGVFRIGVLDAEREISVQSNPILCCRSPRHRLFWGDLHAHGFDANSQWFSLLNEITHPTNVHRYAREIANLDFCAVSPMDPPPPEKAGRLWVMYREAIADANEPGSYVPLFSTEWHGQPGPGRGIGGDRAIVFLDPDTEPPHPYSTVQQIYDSCAARSDALLIPHVGGFAPDWDFFKPRHEQVVEVCSSHGNFEWVLQEALSHGYLPGVVGSSDTHWCTPGHPRRVEPLRGRFRRRLVFGRRDSGCGSGITGVYAGKLDAESIFAALLAGRSYATTGARILLDFSRVDEDMPPVFRLEVHGTAALERIDVLRGDRIIDSINTTALDITTEVEDPACPTGDSAYYLRIVQSDGDYAWSSPIQIRNEGLGLEYNARQRLWDTPEPVDLHALRPNPAEAYEKQLKTYLDVEEDGGGITHLTPVGIVTSTMGKYALFYAFLRPRMYRISIKWFFEFELPRIRYEVDWADYGSRPADEILYNGARK